MRKLELQHLSQPTTVKELKEALNQFPDNWPLIGLAGDDKGKGTSLIGRIIIHQYPGDTKTVVISVQPPPYLE